MDLVWSLLHVYDNLLSKFKGRSRWESSLSLLTMSFVIEMFHDPGECHMLGPTFDHQKRWHSVSFNLKNYKRNVPIFKERT